ncbi:unnamed protein product, partial [marine sediment metagenome]
KVIKANLMRINLGKRLLFCLRMSFLLLLNLIIAGAAKKGYYHFWGKQEWEKILTKKGFFSLSINLTYGGQVYLIMAEKKRNPSEKEDEAQADAKNDCLTKHRE